MRVCGPSLPRSMPSCPPGFARFVSNALANLPLKSARAEQRCGRCRRFLADQSQDRPQPHAPGSTRAGFYGSERGAQARHEQGEASRRARGAQRLTGFLEECAGRHPRHGARSRGDPAPESERSLARLRRRLSCGHVGGDPGSVLFDPENDAGLALGDPGEANGVKTRAASDPFVVSWRTVPVEQRGREPVEVSSEAGRPENRSHAGSAQVELARGVRCRGAAQVLQLGRPRPPARRCAHAGRTRRSSA
jgi:hypothetical protein